MTNNNPSQQGSCESGDVQYMSNPPKYKCVNCGRYWYCEDLVPTCTHPKESPVSPSDLKEALDSVDKQVGGAARALGSQSEGWERQYAERFYGKRKLSDGTTSEYMHLEGTAFDKDNKSFIRTLLTTLVNEMEGLKSDSEIWDEIRGFNAGISAAIEVIKKMGV